MIKIINNIDSLFKKMSLQLNGIELITDIKNAEYAFIHIQDFYEKIDGEFSKELKKKFLDHFTSFFLDINIEIPNLREKELQDKLEKYFNKIINLFWLKYDLETCSIIENTLFYFLLKKYANNGTIPNFVSELIKEELVKIFNNNKDFLTLMLLEWTSKNYYWDDNELKININSNSHFIKIIKLALFKANDSNLDIIISNLNNIFCQNVGDYRNNIYHLMKVAKEAINNIIENNFKENSYLKDFWENFYLVESFIKKDVIIEKAEFQKYEKMLLIYIGFSIQKNIKIDLKLILSNLITKHQKLQKKASNSIDEMRLYTDLYMELWGILDLKQWRKFDLSEYTKYTQSLIYKKNQDEINEFDKILKSKKIIEWFINNLNLFIKEHCQNCRYIETLDKISTIWKLKIYALFNNKEYILDEKKNTPYYLFLKEIDISSCSELMNKNFMTIPEKLKEEIENKFFFKTKINLEENKKNIKNIYGDYLTEDELKEVDEVVLVDNTYLSVLDCFKFSFYEFAGDIIYKLIINSLILDAKIYVERKKNTLPWTTFNELDSSNMQEKICSSIDFNNNISINNSISVQLLNKISNADYFETFIYFIFKIKGFEYCKRVILKLIEKNYPSILVPDDVYEEALCDYKNLTKNKALNFYKKEFIYNCLIDSGTWISKGKPTKFIKIERLQRDILSCCIKLNLINIPKLAHFVSSHHSIHSNKIVYSNILEHATQTLLKTLYADNYNFNYLDDIALTNSISDFNENYEKFNSRLIDIMLEEIENRK